MCLSKINIEGQVIGRTTFLCDETESVENVCITCGGVYLTSKYFMYSDHTEYLGIKKLNLTADRIIVDTVLPVNRPNNICCLRTQGPGIRFMYNIDSVMNHRTTGHCTLFLVHFDGEKFKSSILLKSEKQIDYATAIEEKNHQLGIYVKMKDSITEIVVDSNGNRIRENSVGFIPDVIFGDGRCAYLGPYVTQVDRLLDLKIYNPPRYEYIYRVKLYLTDSTRKKISEIVLIPDTSGIINSVRLCHLRDGDFLVTAIFEQENKSAICTWKLDQKANIVWQKWHSVNDYNLAGLYLFETQNEIVFFSSGSPIPRPKDKFGWDLFMMRLDLNGNIIIK